MAALGATTIIKRIREGAYDKDVREINTAAYERSKLLREQRVLDKRADLHNGVRVEITDGIKPAYLVGWKGTVASVAKTRAVVDFDGTRGRFHGEGLRCPIDCLKVVK